MEAGDTFKFGSLPHLWVVISDPAKNPENVLFVNFSTDRGLDPSCILHPGDHRFVRRRTCVVYRRARVERNADLDCLLASGRLVLDDPVSGKVLERIRQGAAVSEFMPLGSLRILIDQGLVEPS